MIVVAIHNNKNKQLIRRKTRKLLKQLENLFNVVYEASFGHKAKICGPTQRE